MPCKIYLRHDQSIHQRQHYSSNEVTIFAPLWIKSALNTLGEQLNGIIFEVLQESGLSNHLESVTITRNFNDQSLKILQKIARNEPSNVTGVINTTLYPDIADKMVLYSIRDLVRQCIIVGVDECSHYGGYGCNRQTQPKKKVYICDLAALQFQQPYNTGRLVLIQETDEFHGILDNLIYEHVVGEQKRSFSDIVTILNKNDSESEPIKQRYIRHDGYGLPGQGSCFLDANAYSCFVKQDVILYGLALQKMIDAHHPNEKIHFKFLKYGTGFFAWRFANILDELILSAVLDGLDELLEKPKMLDIIKHIELPFYKFRPCDTKRLENFKSKYAIDVSFSSNDALKHSPTKGLIVSTTNCGDNHAVCGKIIDRFSFHFSDELFFWFVFSGNEMEFCSVDAAIAENLKSRGNIFSPNINLFMTEEYIEM